MDEPIKTLWQVYLVKKDGTLVFSAATLAYDAAGAVKALAAANSSKMASLTWDKIDVYAREIGFPLAEKTVRAALQ